MGVSFIFITVIVLFANRSLQIDIISGDVSSTDIYAPRSIVDTINTNALRKAASDGVEDVYIKNDSKRIAASEKLTEFFSAATSLRASEEDAPAAKALKLQAAVKIDISEASAAVFINASEEEFSLMRNVTGIVNEIMSEGVDDKEAAVSESFKKIELLDITDSQKEALCALSEQVIVPNIELDKEETKRRKEAAWQSVPDIEYKKNQIIVRKGEIVTDSHIAMLKELGIVKGSRPMSSSYTLGIVMMSLICYILILAYLYLSCRESNNFAPLAAIMGVGVILTVFYGSRYVPERFIPILPVGAYVAAVTVFSDTITAIIFNMVISLLCGVACGGNWDYTVCLMLSGSLSAYYYGRVTRRSHLIPAAVISSVGYAAVFFAMSLIQASSVKTAVLSFVSGFSGGILSGILTIGTLPFWEWILNATTPMKLTELANPENKLLKRLLVEAPGTYHHSLTVANISEIAAREIGANSLLARVGAYYHDIGKLKNPLYFKENQYNENVHDNLMPQESAEIIIRHVQDGAELAAKYHVPKAIRDIIVQHHGTTTTGYFLLRARELDKHTNPDAFTYPGPIPETKEAAIVMLADSCEAAVRSMSEKNEDAIEHLVRRLATERVNSGQFNRCNLTFSELETIIRTIVRTMGGYFHERVKYE